MYAIFAYIGVAYIPYMECMGIPGPAFTGVSWWQQVPRNNVSQNSLSEGPGI